MNDIPANYPRTQAEWRRFTLPSIWLDDVEIKIANWGTELPDREWYVPEGKAPLNRAERIYLKEGERTGMSIIIDPRYSFDQNRRPEYYRDCYRGEPETWTHEDGEKPMPICAPYESDYKARLADEQRRGVKYTYQYEWLEHPK